MVNFKVIGIEVEGGNLPIFWHACDYYLLKLLLLIDDNVVTIVTNSLSMQLDHAYKMLQQLGRPIADYDREYGLCFSERDIGRDEYFV